MMELFVAGLWIGLVVGFAAALLLRDLMGD